MLLRKGGLDSFGTVGIGVALGLIGCAGATNGTNSGTSGTTGASGQTSSVAGSGVAGTAIGTGTGGLPSSSGGTDSSTAGTAPSTGGGTSGAPASSAGSGGAAGSDVSTPGGSGGSDVSTPDAGAVSGTGCTGLLFCDDFESYAVGATPSGKWTFNGSGKAVIDTTMSFGGTKSVHFTGTASGIGAAANLRATGAPVFPIQGNTLFVRAMMYINSYPASSGTHTRLMRIGLSSGGEGDGSSYAMDTYNGTGMEHVNSGMFRDTSFHLMDTAAKGKWICWEWELDNKAGPPSGDTGTVMAYVWHDGVALNLATTHDSKPWDPIAWQMFEIGFEAYQADTLPADFWIDDVALSSTKIACPTK